MKRLLCLLLFCAAGAQAAPFLVSDPSTDPAVDTCALQEGTVLTRLPTVAGACHADLTAATPGAHSITVWFESSVWGTQSAAVPFTFSRPIAGATGPGGLGIRKN